MSKEKYQEMAKVLIDYTKKNNIMASHVILEDYAEHLYDAGYRKQSEGKWTRFEVNGINYGQVYYQHKECKTDETQLFPTPYNFCPNCGAHMRKEDEGK